MLGLFLGALDQTIVGPALPTIVTQLSGNDLLRLGRHHLPAHEHDQRSVLGQALGHLRPQADLHDRHRDLPDRLRAVRPQPEHGDAHPVPGHPGRRRGLAVPRCAVDHRRHVHPGGARPIPGPVRRRVRCRVRRRSAHRRLADGERQLALDLLRQHPDRDHRARRHPAPPADRQDEGRQPQLRHPGRGDLHDRHDRAAHRPDLQGPEQPGDRHPVRVDRPAGGWPDPRRHRRLRPVRSGRGPRQGAHRPARPVASRAYSASMVSIFFAAFAFFGAIVFLPRWFQVVAGLLADELGPRCAAARHRPHRQLDSVGHPGGPHGPLQAASSSSRSPCWASPLR